MSHEVQRCKNGTDTDSDHVSAAAGLLRIAIQLPSRARPPLPTSSGQKRPTPRLGIVVSARVQALERAVQFDQYPQLRRLLPGRGQSRAAAVMRHHMSLQ